MSKTVLKEPKREIKKEINKMMFVLTAPIIAHAQNTDVPDNLREDIKTEMLKAAMIGSFDMDEALDVEALAYVMTSSLVAPLSHSWYKIYVHLFKKHCDSKNVEMPFKADDVQGLNTLEERDLQDLKRWIRKKQKQHMKDRS